MITNNNDITKYSQYNKQYLPQEYINNNYIYRYNGDYLNIITDRNCYYNYNTQYCDCNNYNWKTNVMEITYQCRRSDQYTSLTTSQLTSDINYSQRIMEQYTRDKIITIGIFIIAFLILISLLKERKSL